MSMWLLGQGALHEPHYSVADETAIVVVTVLRQVAQAEHVVAAHGQIAYRVEQRAVEVEDDEFGFHAFTIRSP